MHDNDPYGYLGRQETAIPIQTLALRVGVCEAECGTLLTELLECGCLQRNAAGVIFDPELLDQQIMRATKQRAGRIGGIASAQARAQAPPQADAKQHLTSDVLTSDFSGGGKEDGKGGASGFRRDLVCPYPDARDSKPIASQGNGTLSEAIGEALAHFLGNLSRGWKAKSTAIELVEEFGEERVLEALNWGKAQGQPIADVWARVRHRTWAEAEVRERGEAKRHVKIPAPVPTSMKGPP